MTKHITILLAFLMTIGSQASAFDYAHLQKLKDTNECVRCDLSGANLSGANLGGANLRYAIVTDADLSSANLGGANLTHAELATTFMSDTILCNTIMPDGSVIYSGC